MSRFTTSSGLRCIALASVALVACGSDDVVRNAETTTLPAPAVTQEDAVEPTDTEPTDTEPTDTEPTDTEPTGTDPTDAGADGDEPSDTVRPPDDTTPADTTPADTTPATGDSSDDELSPTGQALADVAIADLVERRGVDRTAVVVVEVAEVTWSDGSLGCPQRGMQYLQVLTPGVRVIVEADGQRAFYHGTSTSDLAYCASPRPPVAN